MPQKILYTKFLHKSEKLTLSSYLRRDFIPFKLKRNSSLSSLIKYSPDQPRVPAGTPEGGQWTINTGTYVVTSSGINSIQIKKPDGSIEKRIGGSRAWRNNNPGNIRDSNFARRNGAIGQEHGFAVFPDKETGYRASERLLRSESYFSLTIHQSISRRSPLTENDTSRLQMEICRSAQLSGNRIISSLTSREFNRLLEAIHRFEGWQEGIISVKKP